VFEIVEPAPNKLVCLERFESDPRFAPALRELRSQAALLRPRLQGTLWMINSTARGGGVAEMLPTLVLLLRELGFSARWGVIGADRPAFFAPQPWRPRSNDNAPRWSGAGRWFWPVAVMAGRDVQASHSSSPWRRALGRPRISLNRMAWRAAAGVRRSTWSAARS